MQFKTISELKAAARAHLKGKYSQCILIILAFIFISYFISFLSIGKGSSDSLSSKVVIYLATYLCSTLQYLLKIGLFHFFIKICCNDQFSVKDVFNAFSINGSRNFFYSLFMTLFETVCFLPFSFLIVKAYNGDKTALIYGLIVFILGLISYIFVNICFSQIFFLIFDFPDKSLKDLIKLSIWLMKGQKLRYLLMVISFIPLEILGYLSCGIGLLWVMPYKYSCYACFYLDLTKNKTA